MLRATDDHLRTTHQGEDNSIDLLPASQEKLAKRETVYH